MMRKFYYRSPAEEWKDGLPVGNGRLACMVWGKDADYLTLNHEWLWTGRNRNRRVQYAADGLTVVRRLIREGEHYFATLTANALFGGRGGRSGVPGRVDDYQPAGELRMEFTEESSFTERELDIYTGIAGAKRICGKAEVRTEVFADCRNGCIRICWTADFPFSGKLSLTREPEEGTALTLKTGSGFLRMDGHIAGGTSFAVLTALETDGKASPKEDCVEIRDALRIECAVNMATDHDDLEKELNMLPGLPGGYEADRAAHAEKFRSLMTQVDFYLEENTPDIPEETDRRIQRMRDGGRDNGLCALYFDMGRYLMISSSVCGQLPANLQGKWNDQLTPPWNCDYHFDINLEMNYWLAEPSGLSVCSEALIRYVRSFISSGKEAARNLYGCKGIVLPIQTDAWGISTPESMGWAVWIGAAPWIARQLWDHYRYTGDKVFLKEQAYEFFRLIAEFYEDYLQKDEKGVYQILPSQSPENSIAETGNIRVLIDQSTAMDVQLCFDSLGYAIRTAEILGTDADKVQIWKEMRDNLPPFAIGSDGRLMEWQKEYTEWEPGHRHLSHLYGLYPSDLFTEASRPEQYQAAIRSLDCRMSHGGGHTGWSRAWVSCISARIGRAKDFYEHFTALIRDFATASLLDLHPPRIFQIEGNFGGTAAVIESVVSFYDDTAHLMRSIPEEWSTGHLNGIKIPGGHILNVSWKNGQPEHITMAMGFADTARVEWNGQLHTVTGTPGTVLELL